ncbi:MAG: hypothetical protein KGM47_01350 [Acidobacteriota bacterium]|nr:hypothetical protein [Acidobacteriota bacterium]
MAWSIFEKYTERARKVIFIARLRAGQRGAKAIEIGDLLAAIVIEDQGGFKGVATGLYGDIARVFDSPQNAFFSKESANAILSKLEEGLPRSLPVPQQLDMPLDDGSKRLLTEAARLADGLKHSKIGPLHLLAAALAEGSGDAARIFADAGITREMVMAALGEGKP